MEWVHKNQKTIRTVLTIAYILFILSITVFSRKPGSYRTFKGVFWELQVGYWKDIAENILLFIPLGFLIGGKKGLITGFCLTVIIECTQYIFSLGYSELDDVLNNFIGTFIGVYLKKQTDSFCLFGQREKMYKNYIKRIIDVIISIIALPFFAIIFLILAPIIYFTDRGPIFYNAPRVGKDGKLFKMYKFRSMYVNAPDIRNADGSTYNSKTDARVTPIGKFIRKTSLDETAQCLNTLNGTMSIIGPRPDLPTALEKYDDEERKKLDVRPGITGYNQAYYRNSVTWKESLKHDVYYVENCSFILDIKIIFKTIQTVLLRRGLNRN